MNIPIKTERKFLQMNGKAIQLLSISILKDVTLKHGDKIILNSKNPTQGIFLNSKVANPQEAPYWVLD